MGISCTARGDDLLIDVVINVDPERMIVLLLSDLPFTVSEERRFDMPVAVPKFRTKPTEDRVLSCCQKTKRVRPLLIDRNEICFHTCASSRKVTHYRAKSKVCVYFCEKGQRFSGVKIKENMQVLTDRTKRERSPEKENLIEFSFSS